MLSWAKRAVVVTCCLGLVLNVGCRLGGPGGGSTGEQLVVEQLEGDYALGGRFEDGIPVTDVSFDPVHFRYDSYQIDDSEIGRIEEVAEYMQREGAILLVVEGHCDERGSREYNMALGEHRALAVRAYLIGLGIKGQRIQTRSYGEERPVDFGHTEEAWHANRRGLFALFR